MGNMTTGFFYTGIGSRETPKAVLAQMRHLAGVLAERGWILRSGGAPGADTAFEEGAPENRRRIYIPWNGFSDRTHNKAGSVDPAKIVSKEIYEKARSIAARHHPGWANLKEPVRKLMTRNVFQVLGDDLATPSKFVWCWAPNPQLKDGKIVDVNGGTGLAVRVAEEFGVAVYHLGYPPHVAAMEKYFLSLDTMPAHAPPQPRRM
jgi:hypothetical protein